MNFIFEPLPIPTSVRKECSAAVGLCILLLLASCANAPLSRQLLNTPPTDIPAQAELEGVPFFPQRRYECGPAALATILGYLQLNVLPDELASKVYIPERKGSLQIEMLATARAYGVLGYKLAPRLDALLHEIDHGNPVLVFQNLTFDFWPTWHYAVVVGYDLDSAQVILRSGTTRRYVTDLGIFERTWQRADYWAYVFVRPGIIPATAELGGYTEATLQLERAGFSQAALLAYRAGVEKWPDQTLALIALGNAEYSAGNLNNAIGAFNSELKLRPNNASAWNNLAYALAAKQCRSQAQSAIACAQQLSPGDSNIQSSAAEINSQPVADTGLCEVVVCPVAKAPSPSGTEVTTAPRH